MDNNKQLTEAGIAKILQAGIRKPVEVNSPGPSKSGLITLTEAFKKMAEAKQEAEANE